MESICAIGELERRFREFANSEKAIVGARQLWEGVLIILRPQPYASGERTISITCDSSSPVLSDTEIDQLNELIPFIGDSAAVRYDWRLTAKRLDAARCAFLILHDWRDPILYGHAIVYPAATLELLRFAERLVFEAYTGDGLLTGAVKSTADIFLSNVNQKSAEAGNSGSSEEIAGPDLAKLLGVAERTVNTWVGRGIIHPSIYGKRGRSHVFNVADTRDDLTNAQEAKRILKNAERVTDTFARHQERSSNLGIT